eukprot:403374689
MSIGSSQSQEDIQIISCSLSQQTNLNLSAAHNQLNHHSNLASSQLSSNSASTNGFTTTLNISQLNNMQHHGSASGSLIGNQQLQQNSNFLNQPLHLSHLSSHRERESQGPSLDSHSHNGSTQGQTGNSGSGSGSSSSGSSENIQVFLRMRPLNQREVMEEQVQNAWKIQDSSILLDQNIMNQPYSTSANGQKMMNYASTAYANIIGSGTHSKAYTFNKCFDDSTPNNEVYSQACKEIVKSSLEGINGTIFMYGQTGAGKTFTMLGERYQSEIREQAAMMFNQQTKQQRVGSSRGHKTPLKGSFLGASTSHTTSIQNFNSNIVCATEPNDKQISPISSHKNGTGQNITPMRRNTNLAGNGISNHRSTLSQIGRLQTTETPRHIKNSASGKNQSGTRIPLPLYKQQSVTATTTQQNIKTRNNPIGSFNKSLSIGGQQLFQTGSAQMPGSISDFTQNNMYGGQDQNNQDPIHSNVLMGLQLGGTPGNQTERNEYVLCQEDQDELQMYSHSNNVLNSARHLNFNNQLKSGEQPQSTGTEGILIQSLKELFSIIKNESHLNSRISPIPQLSDDLQIINDHSTSNRESFHNMPQKVYIIRCSYFEIYNDAVYDLLCEQSEMSFHEPLQLQEDNKRKEFVVKGLKENVVQSLEDCLALLRVGEVNRHYAETKMNHQSSRSHTLFRLHVESVACGSNGSQQESANVITESVLNFVDLAGSEKVSNHTHQDSANGQNSCSQTRKDTSQMRVREGQHINKSLFFLTQVIALKAEGKKNEQHIPYRNSPLTKILRSSLGGNSRTAIILCITPAQNQLEQTFSTLRFGQNAKMIKNQVVANVVKKTSSEDEAELKAILFEYEKKLGDMQKDSENNHNKLQQVIETLVKEKQELNSRLLRANNKKLQDLLEQKQEQQNDQKDHRFDKQHTQVKSFYLFDCGILNSYFSLDTFIPKHPSESLQDKKQSETFSIDYIVKLNDRLESQNSKIMISTLKQAKKENRELRLQVENLRDDNEDIIKQVEILEKQNSDIQIINADLKNQNQIFQTQLQHISQELIYHQEKSKVKEENLNQELCKYLEQMKMLSQQLDKEVNEKENMIEKYQYLLQTRYQIDQQKIVQESQERLVEIEQLLYKGIQLINQEKGRRFYIQSQNGMLFANQSVVQQFQMDTDYNQNCEDTLKNGQQTQIHITDSNNDNLQENNQGSQPKCEIIDHDEQEFLGQSAYSKKLDFDIIDMSKVQRDTSSYLQSNIIPSDQYTIDDQNIMQQNRQSDELQTFHQLSQSSNKRDESSIQGYSDAKMIVHSNNHQMRFQENNHNNHKRDSSPSIEDRVGHKRSERGSRKIVKDFIDSNDISQINSTNMPNHNQMTNETYERINELHNQKEYVSQSPINLKQIKQNGMHQIASVQSLMMEEAEETFDEKTRLQDRCQAFQRQINYQKVSNNHKDTNLDQKTPQKSFNSNQNQSLKFNGQQLRTPNNLQTSSDQYSRFNFENEFNDSLKFMGNQGCITSKAQNQAFTDIFNHQNAVNYSNQSNTQSLLLSQTKQTQSSNSKDHSNFQAAQNMYSQLQDEPVNYQVYLSNQHQAQIMQQQHNTQQNIQQNNGNNQLRVSINTQNLSTLNQLLASAQQFQSQNLLPNSAQQIGRNQGIKHQSSTSSQQQQQQRQSSNNLSNKKQNAISSNKSKYLSKDTVSTSSIYLDDTRRHTDTERSQQQQFQPSQFSSMTMMLQNQQLNGLNNQHFQQQQRML